MNKSRAPENADSSDQFTNRLGTGDDTGNVSGDVAHQANLANIEQHVHDRGNEVLDGDRFGRWRAGISC